MIEFGVSKPHDHLSIDVRARVATMPSPEPPDAPWTALESRAYREAAGEFAQPFGPEPDALVLDELVGLTRGATPLATLRTLVELIPDRPTSAT